MMVARASVGESVVELNGLHLVVRKGHVSVVNGRVVYASADADYTLTAHTREQRLALWLWLSLALGLFGGAATAVVLWGLSAA